MRRCEEGRIPSPPHIAELDGSLGGTATRVRMLLPALSGADPNLVHQRDV